MRRRSTGIILVVWLGLLHAETDVDTRALREEATRLFAQKEYAKVVERVGAFVQENGRHDDNEFLVPILIEAAVRTGKYSLAGKLFRIYRRRYDESDFMPRLWYLQGYVEARSEEYTDAMVAFSNALSGGVQPDLEKALWTSVDRLCKEALTSRELDLLAGRRHMHPKIVARLEEYAHERAQSGVRTPPAMQDQASSPASAGRAPRGQVRIGVLAPLSGFDADIGRRIVQGIQIAVQRFNAVHPHAVRLIIRDTRGNMVETANRTLELINDQKINLILGPVLSQNAVVTAALIREKEVLMISPTATDDGIAGLGPLIFQMNVTLCALGRTIARYAVQNLNIDEFVVISPLSEYGMTLARTFKEEVKALGAEVAAEEFFEEGTVDFKNQFVSLRKKLHDRRLRQITEEQGEEYVSSRSFRRADSLYYADSTMRVGGIFMPAETDEVVMLAPSVFFHKIQGQMLGATGWHTTKTILDGKRYVRNAIISTNFEAVQSDPRWQKFRAAYKGRFSGEPDRISALGYDAAFLLLSSLKEANGKDDAESVAAALRERKPYSGMAGRVRFDPQKGANVEAAIMKISGKEFVRIH